MNERQIRERYDLTIERISTIVGEKTVAETYRDYFQKTAKFILDMNAVLKRVQNKKVEDCTLEELKEENKRVYQDIIGENYSESYANPVYAVCCFGEELGRLLSFLYAEIRSEIPYAYENKLLYLTICNELFIEIYNCFEGEETPNYKELKDIIYWYVSDYSDVFVADVIEERLNPACSFAVDIIQESDLRDFRYLYKYGEFVSENEWKIAEHLNLLSQEALNEVVDNYMKECQDINLTKKEIMNISYPIGFERVVKKMIEKFAEMGVKTTIYRAPVSVLTKQQQTTGYYGSSVNKQYEQDHRFDQGLVLNKKLVERKLDVMKNAYEQYKELAVNHAGSVVMKYSYDEPSVLERNEAAVALTEKQEELVALFMNRESQLSNKYLLPEVKSRVVDIHKWD